MDLATVLPGLRRLHTSLLAEDLAVGVTTMMGTLRPLGERRAAKKEDDEPEDDDDKDDKDDGGTVEALVSQLADRGRAKHGLGRVASRLAVQETINHLVGMGWVKDPKGLAKAQQAEWVESAIRAGIIQQAEVCSMGMAEERSAETPWKHFAEAKRLLAAEDKAGLDHLADAIEMLPSAEKAEAIELFGEGYVSLKHAVAKRKVESWLKQKGR